MSTSIEDFVLLSVIGKGSYAKVLLVRSNKDQQVFAMKILKKKYIASLQLQEKVLTEKQVLASIKHPFLVNLHQSFQDQKKLYLVLEYCPGGELYGLLKIKEKLTEEQCKFYSAQILLALEALHKFNVIYRDLKPENILLDKKGYIKLADFGLSKILNRKEQVAMTICGTPQYLAPEILFNKGHGLAVDWWCLGCLMFEMLTGMPPFASENHSELYELIKFEEVEFPSNVSDKMKSLLSGLLEKKPQKRLGAEGGADQIKKHPFFDKINWQTLENRGIKAPFLPVIKSEVDLTNFDVTFTSSEIESYQDPESLQIDQKYCGFSFETGMN